MFGGFTDISWSSEEEYKDGNCKSFIFYLEDDFNFEKLEINLDEKY